MYQLDKAKASLVRFPAFFSFNFRDSFIVTRNVSVWHYLHWWPFHYANFHFLFVVFTVMLAGNTWMLQAQYRQREIQLFYWC